MIRELPRWSSALLAAALAAAACAPAATPVASEPSDATEAPPAALTPIKLQLQWFPQAQFGGYYAALAEGYYAAEGLDVTILPGAVDIVPSQVLATGQAEFAVSWVPRGLKPREEGAAIVNIGQVFQRSGTLMVSWKDSNITSIADFAGKKVGNWGFGNEFELLAAINAAGLVPGTDLELVQQNFDMNALLNREIDVAEAMTYNEYAQVLESVNPATGELYQPEDLNVISFNDVKTAMLQDALWAREEWLTDSANQELAVKFLRATYKGWIFCRDNVAGCVEHVLAAGTELGESHQLWQMNEINKLIWPSPATGVGTMDPALWAQTVDVAVSQKILNAAPTDGAYRTDLTEQALEGLKAEGLDVVGAGYQPITVELVEGGK
ncbi:MAG TPA: ABC transporter substrate-binding protein [Anaerolineales bacterium]|nr:ABC transporter substrate-binding protein [Anaerolineales bacterium]